MENGVKSPVSPGSPLNGKSLSGLTGSTTRTFEQIQVPAKSLDQLLAEIRRLGATGSVTVHFAAGRARVAEWKGETTHDAGERVERS